ncbi:EAL domain-containing protein [uncultured Aquitalea sp.]|uniref:bifunctional diguanylate cyclase/phosphodiesterase n=1 Tax=uncultured Aquitalea sp. TaxID=540272 RepID=UPI0025EC2E24|nr:EAL domain-containing protein [uncultured Aquitalea sp.]
MPKRPYRIYLLFFLLTFAAMAALIAFLMGAAYRQRLHQAETDSANVVGVLETRLEATLRRTEALLDDVAASTPPEAFADEPSDALRDRIYRQLGLQARLFPEIVGLRLVRTDGRLMYASDVRDPASVANARGRSYVEALKREPTIRIFFSEVSEGRMSHRQQLHIAVPVRDSQGRLLGLAMAPLDLGYFQNLFARVDLGAHGVITFRRSDDGRLVLRQPPRAGSTNQTLKNNPMHMRVEAGEREGVIRFEAALDKTDRIYAFKRVGDYPFYVAAGIALQDILPQWKKTLTGATVGALIGLALLAWLLRRLFLAERRRELTAGALRDTEDRFQLLLGSVGEGICALGRGGEHLFSNQAARRLLGYGDEAAIDRDAVLNRLHDRGEDGQLTPGGQNAVARALRDGTDAHSQDAVFRCVDGNLLSVQYDAYPLRRGDEDLGTVLLFQDITERKRDAARIAFLAHHDPLTSLPNRLFAEERFSQAASLALRHGEILAMLFLDLDGFKTINDSLGHDVGDKVLQTIARRLQSRLRQGDTVCRLGGDEFLLLLTGARQLDQLLPLFDGLLAEVEQPMEPDGHRLITTASIGVAVFPQDGRDFTTLMKQADTAMYHAKDAGRNTYRLYDEAMYVQARETLNLRSRFVQALAQSEFRLHYQPQLNLADGRVVGAEALVRWQESAERLLPPGHFIPLAESSGMIVALGEWVLQEACSQATQWRDAGYELVVAVNISVVQFKRGNLELSVESALRQSGLPPHLLELELTESLLLHQTEAVISTLQRLRELGVRLAIDDFGTGYSSLAYLKRLAVNKLKIDRSFVQHLRQSPEDEAIVRAIIEMARTLNLQTLAEGVEDEATAQALHSLRCEEAQGYLFARPMPPSAFADYLAAATA